MNWDGNDIHIVLDAEDRCNLCKDLDKNIIFESVIVNYLPKTIKLIDILLLARLFSSKNEARKNWRYGFDIEEGFSFEKYTKLGKLRKNLYILNVPNNYRHDKCKEESEK